MIYLIKSRDYLKIGYSDDVKKRMLAYATHNPDFELLESKTGDKKDETLLHQLCKPYLYKNEWFNDVEEVRYIWEHFTETEEYKKLQIDKKIEDLKNKLLKSEDDLLKLNSKLCKFKNFSTDLFKNSLLLLLQLDDTHISKLRNDILKYIQICLKNCSFDSHIKERIDLEFDSLFSKYSSEECSSIDIKNFINLLITSITSESLYISMWNVS